MFHGSQLKTPVLQPGREVVERQLKLSSLKRAGCHWCLTKRIEVLCTAGLVDPIEVLGLIEAGQQARGDVMSWRREGWGGRGFKVHGQ